jgi:hypothetical protein
MYIRTREYTDIDGHTSKNESRNDGIKSNMAETEPDLVYNNCICS